MCFPRIVIALGWHVFSVYYTQEIHIKLHHNNVPVLILVLCLVVYTLRISECGQMSEVVTETSPRKRSIFNHRLGDWLLGIWHQWKAFSSTWDGPLKG